MCEKKKPTWVSALLGKESTKSVADPVSLYEKNDSIVRGLTARLKGSDKPDDVTFARQMSKAADTTAATLQKLIGIGEKIVSKATKVSDEQCRDMYRQVKDEHPDWKYTRITDEAASRLGISGRTFRKYVPNSDSSTS